MAEYAGQTAVAPKPAPWMPQTQPGAMTNLGGIPMPVQGAPLQGPNLPGTPAPPAFNFNAPTIGAAPTPTPFGAFTAPSGPNPYQFRVDQANQGANRSAAAHGTLLSGGFQTALAKLNQGLASEETQNVYNRALSTYGTNRDTNQQNFGQSLGAYQAGTGATLDAGRLGLAGATAGYDRAYGAQRDAHGDAVQAAQAQTGVINVNNQARDLYEQQMADYRAALERQQMQQQPAPLGFAPRAPLPGTSGRMRRSLAGRAA
jgi:hypothetical protein